MFPVMAGPTVRNIYSTSKSLVSRNIIGKTGCVDRGCFIAMTHVSDDGRNKTGK